MINPEFAGTKNKINVSVRMNEVGDIKYDPTCLQRQTIDTSALNGCIAVVALFRGQTEGDASVLLSHFPPSGDANRAASNISDAATLQSAHNRKPETIVIMAPGRWSKDDSTGFMIKKPYATVEPDIEGYKLALKASADTKVIIIGYTLDDSALQGYSFDPTLGTMTAAFYPSANGIPQLMVSAEGSTVPVLTL